jgi:pimeloyl-ACP methyl ester carboxylesterase
MVSFCVNTNAMQGMMNAMPRVLIHLVQVLFFTTLAVISCSAAAQGCATLPQERSIPDGKGCLAVWPFPPHDATNNEKKAQPNGRVLIVLLHGDSGGGLAQRHIDRWAKAANNLSGLNQNIVFLVRPGYSSPVGDSSGWANQRDDDYTAENVERVATALHNLKERYQASKVLLLGHSGGAAIASLILGRYPTALDGAILLGCPCDVPVWRQHRGLQRGRQTPWPNSLNPMDVIDKIPTRKMVLAITGSQDDNTLPQFAEAWTTAASARGIRAKFLLAPDQDHTNILLWPGLAEQVKQIIKDLTSARP